MGFPGPGGPTFLRKWVWSKLGNFLKMSDFSISRKGLPDDDKIRFGPPMAHIGRSPGHFEIRRDNSARRSQPRGSLDLGGAFFFGGATFHLALGPRGFPIQLPINP